MKNNPIIAVLDVEKSARWYQEVFGLTGKHGGPHFEVLVSDAQEVMLCLHKWGEHEHPSMIDAGHHVGNGLILYFRTENIEEVRQRLQSINYEVETEIQLNPNSGKKEFSVKDPDGYYLTVSELHEF